MSTPASPPITVRPVARAGQFARRLPARARAGVVRLLRLVRQLLTRVLWLLRGWSGLIAGALVALALGLGPAGGTRWIGTQATALSRYVAAAVTLSWIIHENIHRIGLAANRGLWRAYSPL